MEAMTALLLILAVAFFFVAALRREPLLRYAAILVCIVALLAAIIDPTLGVDGSYDRVLLIVLTAALALMSCIWVLVPSEGRR